jgi:hypothetical protein
MRLRKEFPHDRVLERMIHEEFAKNQVFRHPLEWDVYDQEQDEKLKRNVEKYGGLRKEMSEYGTVKKEEFE